MKETSNLSESMFLKTGFLQKVFYKVRTKSQISNNNYTDYNYDYSELSLINIPAELYKCCKVFRDGIELKTQGK